MTPDPDAAQTVTITGSTNCHPAGPAEDITLLDSEGREDVHELSCSGFGQAIIDRM